MYFGFYSKVMGSHWWSESDVMLVYRAFDWLGVSSLQKRKGENEDTRDKVHLLHNLSNGQSLLGNEERIKDFCGD